MLQAHHFQVFNLSSFLDNSHFAQEFQLTIPALIFLGTLREPGASGYGRGRQARVSCLPQTVHPKLRRQGPYPSRPLRRQEVPMHNVRKEVQREHTSQKTLVHTYR